MGEMSEAVMAGAVMGLECVTRCGDRWRRGRTRGVSCVICAGCA